MKYDIIRIFGKHFLLTRKENPNARKTNKKSGEKSALIDPSIKEEERILKEPQFRSAFYVFPKCFHASPPPHSEHAPVEVTGEGGGWGGGFPGCFHVSSERLSSIPLLTMTMSAPGLH